MSDDNRTEFGPIPAPYRPIRFNIRTHLIHTDINASHTNIDASCTNIDALRTHPDEIGQYRVGICWCLFLLNLWGGFLYSVLVYLWRKGKR